MVKAKYPGTGQGKGGGRAHREGEVVQVRLSLSGATYRALEGRASQDHAALREAIRTGTIELRPESGMNRLSVLELALCPEGWQETRLSWTRCR